MRLLVFGSRSWTDTSAIARYLEQFDPFTTTIVNGKCPSGADAIAERLAYGCGFDVDPFPADFTTLGRRAGPIRNQAMLDSGIDRAGCFWDGSSTGTADMLRRLNQAGVPVDLHKAVVAA